jgi:uncharacterized protein with PIN domain
MMEACGVPHTEIDLVIANGRSVAFDYRVEPGDRIAAFPSFESLDITSITEVRPQQPEVRRFVADCHLGRLARFLRLLGFDTRYDPTWSDHELVRISTRDERTLLTRDVGLLKHGSLVHGCFVRATDPREQVIEVVRRLHLGPRIAPFVRCMACNGVLSPVSKEEIAARLPPRTRRSVDGFARCAACDKIYWKGAHYPELHRIVTVARHADQTWIDATVDAGEARINGRRA